MEGVDAGALIEMLGMSAPSGGGDADASVPASSCLAIRASAVGLDVDDEKVSESWGQAKD